MTVNNTIGAAELLRKYLESPAGSNLLGEMVKMAAELLMDADVDVLCNASYGERSDDRENSRNGHRMRRWDTRAGTISLDVPKLRHGSYMPGLLEPRRRVEQALVSVVCQAYVEGVSTRRVDDLVKSMGIDGMSRSQVSLLAKNLDERVAEFRNRPLDAGPYAYLWLDALFHKVREGGRVVSVATVVATGVSAEGHREILGVDVFSAEDGAGWTAFLRGLVARGLSGVALVISDAHEGLKGAIAAVLDGAAWQRCRTHAMRNLLTRVPKTAQSLVATLVRTIFAQPDVTQVHAQFNRVVDQLQTQFPAVAELLIDAEADLLAFSAFPPEHWRQIWSNNPVRHEAPSDPVEMKGLHLRAVAAARCSWRQSDPGDAGEGGSSLDNDGTGRHCQTARVRQARRRGVRMQEPVVEPPQVERRLEPGGSGPVSSAWPPFGGQLRPGLGLAGPKATTKACGVVVARLQGKSWAPIPSNGQW